MSKKVEKLRIGIIGLTSCEGCQFAIMDLGNKFLDLLEDIEIVQFRLMEERVFVTPKMDICFVEGSVITKANEKIIQEIRRQSDILVALGNCASMGGIHQIKNYHQPEKLIKETYFYGDKIDNLPVLDLNKIVKVDYTIPGCPINSQEFLKLVYCLLRGIKFKIMPRPVCEECQTKGYRCVLMNNEKEKGQMCFGPFIQGGCGAICLKSEMPCQGCRGLYKGAQISNNLKNLEKMGYTKAEINNQMEIYGLRDEVEESL
jgi:coenzyme F420-reducing hydrogenase gamma subunit